MTEELLTGTLNLKTNKQTNQFANKKIERKKEKNKRIYADIFQLQCLNVNLHS